MTPIEGIYFRSRIIHGDLVAARDSSGDQLDPSGRWVPAVKQALVALGNLADLEGALRPLYRENPGLAAQLKRSASDLQFAKYLRNVFGGHINEDLIVKCYEWRPELRMLPDIRELNGTVALNLFVLETAINTYVADDGRHGMFPSETDLVYPPDHERFCAWLTATMGAAIQICDALGEITHATIPPLGDHAGMMDAYMAAGLTDFKRIRKGR